MSAATIIYENTVVSVDDRVTGVSNITDVLLTLQSRKVLRVVRGCKNKDIIIFPSKFAEPLNFISHLLVKTLDSAY